MKFPCLGYLAIPRKGKRASLGFLSMSGGNPMIRTFLLLAVIATGIYGGFQTIDSVTNSVHLASGQMQVVVNGR